MLRRKYTVQKSIRFDQQLAEDLTYLANVLDRSLNDVVNIACEDLIHENKFYFAKLLVVDNLPEIFEQGMETGHFELDNLKVDITSDEKFYYLKLVFLGESGEVIEEVDEKYDDLDALEDTITHFTLKAIDLNSQLVEDYLKHRLDYK